MSHADTFKGYGQDFGYHFLRKAIAEQDYAPYGVSLSMDEIFINDGAKSDTGNIGELFSNDNTVAVCDPVYPVYIDSNVMSGRAGDLVDGRLVQPDLYALHRLKTVLFPALPDKKADIIYLCYPNNPTGAHATREQLKMWVDYALKKRLYPAL